MTRQNGSEQIRAARAGDRDALSNLLARNHARLMQVARSRLRGGLRGKVRPSDLLQSAYYDAVRDFAQFRGEDDDAFVAWMGTIVEHTLHDKGRYFAADKREAARGVRLVTDVAVMDDRQRCPSADAADSDDLTVAREAMAYLSEDQRRVIDLCVHEGRTREEAAVTMGKSVGAVRVLLCRARAALICQVDRLKSDRANQRTPRGGE